MRPSHLLVGLALAVTACAGAQEPVPRAAPESPSPSATPTGVPALPDGPLAAGRYRYVLSDWDTCDPHLGCAGKTTRRAPDIELTVPDGWEAANEFHLLSTALGNGTEGPDGAALVLGWTTYSVGLNSQPCLKPGAGDGNGHQVPDIEVGPTVDDFVDAVVAHPRLDVSTPRPVTLDGHRGRFFTLTGPSDLSGCENWRPWDPGFFAQGPDNTWDVWVIDVSGFRVVVVAHHYPGTAPAVRAQLTGMVRSLRFG